MKKIYKEIETCIECPFLEESLEYCLYSCTEGAFDEYTGGGFDDDYTFKVESGIHRDCPLEDLEE